MISANANQNACQELQSTFDYFRAECSQWENEVTQFFGDLDRFMESSPPPNPVVAADSSITHDLADLRSRVEQQTDVLTALEDALAGEAPTPTTVSPQPEDTDDVVESFLDRVEQLQHAASEG